MVTLAETAAAVPLSPAITIRARVLNALPLIGLGFALIVNAVWMAFRATVFGTYLGANVVLRDLLILLLSALTCASIGWAILYLSTKIDSIASPKRRRRSLTWPVDSTEHSASIGDEVLPHLGHLRLILSPGQSNAVWGFLSVWHRHQREPQAWRFGDQ